MILRKDSPGTLGEIRHQFQRNCPATELPELWTGATTVLKRFLRNFGKNWTELILYKPPTKLCKKSRDFVELPERFTGNSWEIAPQALSWNSVHMLRTLKKQNLEKLSREIIQQLRNFRRESTEILWVLSRDSLQNQIWQLNTNISSERFCEKFMKNLRIGSPKSPEFFIGIFVDSLYCWYFSVNK